MRTPSLVAWMALALGATAACSTSVPLPDASHDAGTTDADAMACGDCPVWLIRCGNKCVDLTVSPNNCSACGAACDSANQVCHGGACMPAARCTSLVTADAGVTVADAGTASTGLRGEYYDAANLTGLKVIRVDPDVDFDFTGAPAPGVAATSFSVRWTGTVTPRFSESYTFSATVDDGARVAVNNQTVIDHWTDGPGTFMGTPVALTAGQQYFIKVEFTQAAGGAAMHLSWSSPSQPLQVVPTTALRPSPGTESCATGACCPSGTGQAPVCCPASTQCIQSAGFTGCCPIGEDCGQGGVCGS